MKRWLIILIGSIAAVLPAAAAVPIQAQVVLADHLPRSAAAAFACARAVPDASLRLTSMDDRAVIPRNYRYPVFAWECPPDYQGVYLFKIKSETRELTVLTKKTRWQPEHDEFEVFLAGKELTLTVYLTEAGKTRGSAPVRVSIAESALEDRIVYRLVQPLFDPTLPNSIEVFDFNRRAPFPVVSFKGGSCAGCHGYADDLAYFNVKNLADRRLFAITRQGGGYRFDQKSLGEFTFFSFSPDGRYTVIVMNALGVFANNPTITEPFDYPYQKGDLYCYDNVKHSLTPLKGASDPAVVEDMPAFSPDGKYVIFSRYRAQGDFKKATVAEMDLYRVPFNDGAGGTPVPVTQASQNHKYQYFARYSPDGRWISFCRGEGAKGIFARASSDIYLLSADERRLIKLNLNREGIMDSWHYWSSDSHWLLFSSNRPRNKMTALYLAYIDSTGRDYPPVEIIDHPEMKINTPQFITFDLDPAKLKGFDKYIQKTYAAGKKR